MPAMSLPNKKKGGRIVFDAFAFIVLSVSFGKSADEAERVRDVRFVVQWTVRRTIRALSFHQHSHWDPVSHWLVAMLHHRLLSLSLSFSPLFSYTEFLDCIQDGCYISLVCVCVWEWGYKALLFFIVLLHSVSCARHLLLRRRSASRLCDSFFMIWLCAPVPYLFLLQTHLLAPVFVCRRRWALSVGRDFFFCGSPDAHTFVFDPHPSPWLSFRWPRFLPLSSRVRVYLARRMRIDFSYYCSGHDPRSAGGKTDRQLTVADEEGPGERERGFICRVIEMSSR